jgi:hypothetical protein
MTTGAIYLWESREAAEQCFNDKWHERLAGKFGGPPTMTWFDCTGVLDNRHNEVFAETS